MTETTIRMTKGLVPKSIDDPRIKPVAQDVVNVTEMAEALEVTNTETYESAANVLMTIKTMHAEVETARKKITSPLDAAKKGVMDLFRPFSAALKKSEDTLKSRMVTWKNEQKRMAAEEQRKAEERARKERERLERAAAKAEQDGREGRAEILRGRADSTVPAVPPPAVPKVGGISDREKWDFEITDARKLPREYTMPDEKRIRKVVNALKGDTHIDGVRVWQEDTIAARRA